MMNKEINFADISLPEMNRRTFVATLSSLVGALYFTPEMVWAQGERALTLPTVIGNKYLQLFGKDFELSDLKSKIQGSVNSIDAQKAVLDTVRNSIADDYLADQTFEFENWLLSKTEGRLCALAYLESVSRKQTRPIKLKTN